MVSPTKDWASGIAADVRWGAWASQGTRDIAGRNQYPPGPSPTTISSSSLESELRCASVGGGEDEAHFVRRQWRIGPGHDSDLRAQHVPDDGAPGRTSRPGL